MTSRRLGWFSLRALAAIGAFFLLVTFTPLVRYWVDLLSGDWYAPQGDVLVVLGGDTHSESILGLSSYWRAVHAVIVFRSHPFPRVILSGKQTAPLMRDFLAASGIPREILEIESSSVSTRENALFTARLLGSDPGRVALLTSDYHSARAARAFRKAGLAVVPVPAPDAMKYAGMWHGRWFALHKVALETAKVVYYWLRGWI